MGQKVLIALRAAKRVSLASAGEIAGRTINLALPFFVLHLYSADSATDRFFFVFSIGFFVFGTLSNILTSVFVPEFISSKPPRNLRSYLRWSALIASCTGLLAVLMAGGNSVLAEVIVLGASAGGMAMAGLVSAPSIAALNADHRYFLPGLTIGLRALPVAVYWMIQPERSYLPFLLSGLAVTDGIRAVVLWLNARNRFSGNPAHAPLKIPASALYLVAAGLIAGSTPVTIRWIASFGDPGSLSVFEVADRLYSAIASLASIGMGSVVLVYLARLEETSDADMYWSWIAVATLAWGLIWSLVGLGIWAAFPQFSDWINFHEARDVNLVRSTFLGLIAGMPAFILTVALGRRLFTAGLSRHLVPMSIMGLCFNLIAGIVLFLYYDTAGLAISLSLSHFLVATLMFIRIRQFTSRAFG